MTNTEMAWKNLKMDPNTQEILCLARSKDTATWWCKTDPIIKATGIKTRLMAKENTIGLMADTLRVNGRTTSFMDSGSTNGLMVSVTPATTLTTWSTDMEYTLGPMGKNMMEVGIMASKMAKLSLLTAREKRKRESG
jgi:hypothetical protein